MKIKYSNGREASVDSEAEAMDVIAADHPFLVACENGWEPNGPGRERLLVWASEDDAEGDDGAHAIAELVREAGVR